MQKKDESTESWELKRKGGDGTFPVKSSQEKLKFLVSAVLESSSGLSVVHILLHTVSERWRLAVLGDVPLAVLLSYGWFLGLSPVRRCALALFPQPGHHCPRKCVVDEMSSWPLGKVLTGSLIDFTTEKHRLTYSKIYPGTCYALPPWRYRFLRFYAASMVPGCSAVCRPYGLSPSSTCIRFAANHQVRDFVEWVARSGSTCVAAQKWASLGRALWRKFWAACLPLQGLAYFAGGLHYLQKLGRKLSVCPLPHCSHFYFLLLFF